MTDPLILTLAIDDLLFGAVDQLRKAYFPPERNLLPAHVTLFHQLPGDQLAAVTHYLKALCDRTQPFDLRLGQLRFLGKGVAIKVDAPPLSRLHTLAAREWNAWLTPQDRQPFSPHITIQNRVDLATARATFADLSAGWKPMRGRAKGLLLWWYRGGPWERAGRFIFNVTADSD